MPRGRPVNFDKRITAALTALKRALVAKEQDQIEQRVAAQMAGLVKGLGGPDTKVTRTPAAQPAPAMRRGPGKGNPKLKSKLKAYWASLSPAQRKARTAKMQAGRKK